MINTKILTSILEDHKLSDEQSEELQKVTSMLDDGSLADEKQYIKTHGCVDILYICDQKACPECSAPRCTHTTKREHSVNYADRKPNLLEGFSIQTRTSERDLIFYEEER